VDGNECKFLGSPVGADGNCHPNVTGISYNNTNTTTTGKPGFKTGSRIMTFALKYYF
jgi:hypothetical protein